MPLSVAPLHRGHDELCEAAEDPASPVPEPAVAPDPFPLAEDAAEPLAAEELPADPEVAVALETPTEVAPEEDAVDDVSEELETHPEAVDEDTAVPLEDGGALVGHPHGLADDEPPRDPDELPRLL